MTDNFKYHSSLSCLSFPDPEPWFSYLMFTEHFLFTYTLNVKYLLFEAQAVGTVYRFLFVHQPQS